MAILFAVVGYSSKGLAASKFTIISKENFIKEVSETGAIETYGQIFLISETKELNGLIPLKRVPGEILFEIFKDSFANEKVRSFLRANTSKKAQKVLVI